MHVEEKHEHAHVVPGIKLQEIIVNLEDGATMIRPNNLSGAFTLAWV